MVPKNGFRPRDRAERLALASFMMGKKPRPTDEDGYVAACAALLTPLGPPLAPLSVTIIICTYNRDYLLKEAVASARSQSWPVQIVVVNDGCTDGTAAWLATQADLSVLTHHPNRGKPAALDTGVAALQTEAFLVLDDDDLLLPGTIAALAAALLDHPNAVAAWGDTVVFDGETKEILDWRPATRVPMTKRAVLTTIPALPGATLVRTSAQRGLAKFEPRLVRGQDMDHFLRLADEGPMVTVPLPVLWYRRHDGLRGDAKARWKKHANPAEHRRRFLACVQPVFGERWAASKHARGEGFAWALGLVERELPELATEELAKWAEPDSPHEAWVRSKAGVGGPQSTEPKAPSEFVRFVVVDDGDDGALEQALLMHAGPHAVEVVLPRPRDSIGGAQIFWPGTYRVSREVRTTGTIRVVLSSSPGWISPAFDAALLPNLPAADAVRALAWASGWDIPEAERPVSGACPHALVAACRAAATRTGTAALAPAIAVMQAMPQWVPGLLLGALACERAGLARDAASLRHAVATACAP